MATQLTAAQCQHAASLMFHTLRERFERAGEPARELLHDEAARWQIAHLWEDAHAMVVLTEPVPARWGPPEPHLHVLTDASSESMRWLEQRLTEVEDALGASVSCRLSAARRELLPPLRRLGLGFSKLGLGGRVPVMLKRVEQMQVVDPDDLGLQLATVSTAEHIRASSALRRDYFLQHPEHGWASATITAEEQAAIDRRVEGEFERRLAEQIGCDFVLLDGEEVVASFGFARPQSSVVVGTNASFNICIAPRWHRRGLGTLAYAVMVRRAAELGVDTMHGSTSNPGVIQIAARMGRKLDNWLLRRDPPWVADELALMPELL